MGNMKLKTEGGQGGGRGHSNQDHWVFTEEIKAATRGRRRREGKKVIERELQDQARGDRPSPRHR